MGEDLELEADEAFARRMGLTQWRTGRTLSDQDVAEVQRLFQDLEDEAEARTTSYDQGLEAGRQEAGGTKVAKLLRDIDELRSKLFVERGMKSFYRALACRIQDELTAARPTPTDKGEG